MKSFQYTETKYMLTVSETTRIFDVSVHTVYRLINLEMLSDIKIKPKKNSYKS